ETEAERDGPEQDRNDLEPPGCEEHDNEQNPQRPGALTLGSEELGDESLRPDFLKRPHEPAREEHERHGDREIHIRVGAAEERFLEAEALRRVMAPSE